MPSLHAYASRMGVGTRFGGMKEPQPTTKHGRHGIVAVDVEEDVVQG